jgi:hypothetical protein
MRNKKTCIYPLNKTQNPKVKVQNTLSEHTAFHNNSQLQKKKRDDSQVHWQFVPACAMLGCARQESIEGSKMQV